MKILLVGATGTVGSAVLRSLSKRHDVILASRSDVVHSVDISDPNSIASLLEGVGPVDALACAAGGAPYKPFAELQTDDFRAGFSNKLLGQVELVRQGLVFVKPGGSFTLITGILADLPIAKGVVASTVNGAIDAFVRAAATDLGEGRRINAVSPTLLEESVESVGSWFPGVVPTPADTVAQAYVRSIEGVETGRVFKVGW